VSTDAESSAPRESRSSGSNRTLRRVAHYGSLGVAVAAPLLIGGGPVWAQVALSAGALLFALLWLVSRRGQVSPIPFAAVAALAVAATLFQLLPLPAPLVGLLSPQALELRTDAAGSRPWFLPLTLDVPATVLAVLRGLGCLALIAVAASATHSRGRGGVFASGLVLVGGAVAALSFAQRHLGMDRVYGVYEVSELSGSGFFGSFVSGNHAASLFTIAALLSIGAAREERGPLRLATGISGLLSGLALVSTGSRGGVVAAALGLLGITALWLIRRFGRQRGLYAAAGLGLFAAPAAFFLALTMRGAGAASLTAAVSEHKVRSWLDMLSLMRDYPLTGVGRGAFEGPAAAYRSDGNWFRLAFPENIFIQLFSEWGIPIALALVALFVVASLRVVRQLPRWEPSYQAAACAVFAVLVHELADFGLEVPGVAFPTALALGLVAGRLQASQDADPQEPRAQLRARVALGLLGVGLAATVASLWAADRTTDADGARLEELVRSRPAQAAAPLAAAIRRHPADYYLELLAAQQAETVRSNRALHHLNRAQGLFPAAPAPHTMTGWYLASIGRPAQAALEFRLGIDRGANTTLPELRNAIGFRHLAAAVPDRPERRLELARFLVANRRFAEAEQASRRALELAGNSEAAWLAHVQLALTSADPTFLRRAGEDAAARPQVSSRLLELAGQALVASGAVTEARAVLARAMRAAPSDGALAVRAGRTLFKQGDTAGAHQLLMSDKSGGYAIRDRIAAEELLVQIAIKNGHAEAAEAARSRARMLTRLMQEQGLR
jgi:O-antigen ligase/tetratricopeptide (TPR) repeat protein